MQRITTPHSVREAVLAAIQQRGHSRYGFARACAEAKIVQQHTVDSVLADPACSTASVPTLKTAIDLLHAAGYELHAVPNGEPLPITTKRRVEA